MIKNGNGNHHTVKTLLTILWITISITLGVLSIVGWSQAAIQKAKAEAMNPLSIRVEKNTDSIIDMRIKYTEQISVISNRLEGIEKSIESVEKDIKEMLKNNKK